MSSQRNDDRPAADARFDAAWREVSNEEPPPALDAAIHAAARREVGAGPERVDREVRAATRPERWWFPLAAAATIGAIALGLLQIAGPDMPFGGDSSTVISDIPPGTTTLPSEAPAGTPAAPLPTLRPPAAGGIRIPPPPPTGQGAPLHAVPGDAPAPSRPEAKLVRRPFAEPRLESTPAPEAAPASPGKLAAGGVEPSPRTASPARAEHSPPADSAAVVPAAPLLPSPPAPRPAVTAKPATAAPPPAKPSTPAAGPAATQFAAPAGVPAPATALAAQRSLEGASTATPAVIGAVGRATSSAERRRADTDTVRNGQDARTPLPVAEWIALIRKLRDDGKVDEARKELAAFRNAHPDHAQLLPPDLVHWEPAAR